MRSILPLIVVVLFLSGCITPEDVNVTVSYNNQTTNNVFPNNPNPPATNGILPNNPNNPITANTNVIPNSQNTNNTNGAATLGNSENDSIRDSNNGDDNNTFDDNSNVSTIGGGDRPYISGTSTRPSNPNRGQPVNITVSAKDTEGLQEIYWESIDTFATYPESASFECNSQTTCNVTWTFTSTQDGLKTINVYATDFDGQVSSKMPLQITVQPRDAIVSTTAVCGNNICESGEADSCSTDCTTTTANTMSVEDSTLTDTPSEPQTEATESIPIPPNSLAIYYFASMGSDSTTLRYVNVIEPVGGGGVTATGIIPLSGNVADVDGVTVYLGLPTWNADSYAVLAYIPALDRTLLLDRTTSFSYSRSVLQVKTKNNFVFSLSERGERNPAIGEFDVFHPLNGDKVGYVSLYPQSGAGGWTITTDGYYYTNNGLYKRAFDSDNSVKLLDSTSSSYGGRFYGVGSRLLSVKSTYVTATQSFDYLIREHSTSTGAKTRDITSFSRPSSVNVEFYDGDTALYMSTLETSNSYNVYKIVNGAPTLLLNVRLGTGETAIGKIDETNGYLIIPILSNGDSRILTYNLATGSQQQMTIPKEDLIGAGYALASAEYLMLNPQ